MSVVAITSVPAFWKIKRFAMTLSKVIKGPFEPINFKHTGGSTKIAYIRVSAKLDPLRVIESINRMGPINKCKLHACIPAKVPDLTPTSFGKKKNKGKLRDLSHLTPEQVLEVVHTEILTELLTKYTCLHDLSIKTDHKLLDEISETLFQRLKRIMETNPASYDCGFKLSSAYRKAHPHFGDFQQILMTLHRIQDAAGEPRTQLVEADLAAFNAKPSPIDKIPPGKVQGWNVKYAERIATKIREHIESLDATASSADSPEEIARKRVRVELKKLTPYIDTIVRDVAKEHLTPDQNTVYRMRIYGEPFLPNRQVLDPILLKLRASYTARSTRIFNMVRFNVGPGTFAATCALNGADLGEAKLIVRVSQPIKYKVRPELRMSIATAFNPLKVEPMHLVDMEEEIDFENGESWD